MRRSRALRMVVLCGLVALLAVAQQGLYTPYQERLTDGVVDWDEGWIQADAVVPLGEGVPPQQAVVQAQRVAMIKAQAAALRIAMRVPVDSERRLESYEALKVRVKGIVAGGEVVSEGQQGRTYRLSLRVPINGVKGLVSEVYAVTAPVPEPLPDVSSRPAGQIPPPPPKPPELPKAAAKEPPSEKTVARLDSVTVDASDAGVKPALQPRILDTQGNVLYSVKTVKPLVAREKTLARYVRPTGSGGTESSWADPEGLGPLPLALITPPWRLLAQATTPPPPQRPRGGGQTLTVKAVQASGTLKADIVVTEETARKLREAEASSGVLSDAKVIVVVRADVGGVESRRLLRLVPEPHQVAAK
jgi:hypothetical protein